MQVIQLIRQSNWIAVNKQLVKVVGCNAAYLLSYLADKHSYFENRGELTPDGYFFATASDVEEDIALSTREQDAAIEKLVNAGLVSKSVKGVPAKRHFCFTDAHQEALLSILTCKTSFDKSAKLELTKAQNLIAQKRKTIYIDTNKENKEKEFFTGKPEFSLNAEFNQLSLNTEQNPAKEHRDELAASEAANPTAKKTRKEKMESWLPLLDVYMQKQMPEHLASTEFMQALQAYLFNRCEGSAHSFFGGMVALEKWLAAMKDYEPAYCVKLLDDALANDYKRVVFESTPAQYKYYLKNKQDEQDKAMPTEANPFAQFGCSDSYFATFMANVRNQYDLQAWVATLLRTSGKLDPAKGIVPEKEYTDAIYRVAKKVKPSIT